MSSALVHQYGFRASRLSHQQTRFGRRTSPSVCDRTGGLRAQEPRPARVLRSEEHRVTASRCRTASGKRDGLSLSRTVCVLRSDEHRVIVSRCRTSSGKRVLRSDEHRVTVSGCRTSSGKRDGLSLSRTVCKASAGGDIYSTSNDDESPPAAQKTSIKQDLERARSKDKGSLLRVAASVGAVTALCKVLGMVREMLLAAFFGIGPVVDAFNYAQIIPGFFLSIVGGINGPCHTAIAANIGSMSKEEGAQIIEGVSSLIGAALLVASLGTSFFAGPLIDLAAPGLAHTSAMTRELAAKQLAIMSPCALLSGLLGIAFGSLSNAGLYLIPALSPALSSIMIILAVAFHAVTTQAGGIGIYQAGIVLAVGYVAGATLQWVVQTTAMTLAGLSRPLHWRWLNPRKHKGMQQIFKVLFPAVVGSGMLQIATYVDLYFASFIPGVKPTKPLIFK